MDNFIKKNKDKTKDELQILYQDRLKHEMNY